MLNHVCEEGIVLSVHVVPSGDVTAKLDPTPFPKFNAQNVAPFDVTSVRNNDAGNVLCVQFIPSGDVAHKLVPPPATPLPTAQNNVPFHVILYHCWLNGNVV